MAIEGEPFENTLFYYTPFSLEPKVWTKSKTEHFAYPPDARLLRMSIVLYIFLPGATFSSNNRMGMYNNSQFSHKFLFPSTYFASNKAMSILVIFWELLELSWDLIILILVTILIFVFVQDGVRRFIALCFHHKILVEQLRRFLKNNLSYLKKEMKGIKTFYWTIPRLKR